MAGFSAYSRAYSPCTQTDGSPVDSAYTSMSILKQELVCSELPQLHLQSFRYSYGGCQRVEQVTGFIHFRFRIWTAS